MGGYGKSSGGGGKGAHRSNPWSTTAIGIAWSKGFDKGMLAGKGKGKSEEPKGKVKGKEDEPVKGKGFKGVTGKIVLWTVFQHISGLRREMEALEEGLEFQHVTRLRREMEALEDGLESYFRSQ